MSRESRGIWSKETREELPAEPLHSSTDSNGKLDFKGHDPEARVICPEHDKRLVLFCEEEGCKKLISVSYLTKEHKNHYFVEIEEKKKEAVMKNIASICQNVFAYNIVNTKLEFSTQVREYNVTTDGYLCSVIVTSARFLCQMTRIRDIWKQKE